MMSVAASASFLYGPHGGGVGLCEYVQHLAMIDYLCFSGTTEGRVAEYVDHLHEHFITPPVVRRGRYMPPSQPGFSIQMTDTTLAAFTRSVGAAA